MEIDRKKDRQIVIKYNYVVSTTSKCFRRWKYC